MVIQQSYAILSADFAGTVYVWGYTIVSHCHYLASSEEEQVLE
ncbi:protein of unknown function [Pseudomonas inefficax]|uniref:Uncharacterized protein n=1 Tax=Pseudomonas inefficax TaxID=2078786 RepID=A0AAQ1SUQ3_9PSED|nr:protein of unknown function [Pseudomonas inefficax]